MLLHHLSFFNDVHQHITICLQIYIFFPIYFTNWDKNMNVFVKPEEQSQTCLSFCLGEKESILSPGKTNLMIVYLHIPKEIPNFAEF